MKWMLLAIVFLFDIPVFAGPAKGARKPASSGQQYREDVRNFAKAKGFRVLDMGDCDLPADDGTALEAIYLQSKSRKVYRISASSFRSSKGEGGGVDVVDLLDMSDCASKEFKY